MIRVRARRKDDKEDEILRIAVLAYMEAEVAEAEDGLARDGVEPSPKFLHRMKRMFQWHDGKLRKGLIYFRQACAAAIGFFLLLLLINEDVRADVFQYIQKVYDEYINFETDIHAPEEMELKHHELGYVPDGYVKVMDSLDICGWIIYENQDGNQFGFIYKVNSEGANTNADNSNIEWDARITSSNMLVYFGDSGYLDGSCNYLIWYKNGYLYELYGRFDYQIMEKIANNIKF